MDDEILSEVEDETNWLSNMPDLNVFISMIMKYFMTIEIENELYRSFCHDICNFLMSSLINCQYPQ
jgi:hypothetical protein